jgi:hypothetical protein
LRCYLTYEKKNQHNFRCCFCGSETSKFKDYKQEAHSYFDTTTMGNGGFLSTEERRKVDEEIQARPGLA